MFHCLQLIVRSSSILVDSPASTNLIVNMYGIAGGNDAISWLSSNPQCFTKTCVDLSHIIYRIPCLFYTGMYH